VSQTPRDDRAANRPGVDPWTDGLWVSDAANFEQLWSLLGAPRLRCFDPAAITAVLVATDSRGNTARYPLYAQLSTANLSEPYEIDVAIEALRRWRRGSAR
jgi:hypothetical protein